MVSAVWAVERRVAELSTVDCDPRSLRESVTRWITVEASLVADEVPMRVSWSMAERRDSREGVMPDSSKSESEP